MSDDGKRIRQCIWEGKEEDVMHSAIFKERLKQKYV